MYIRRPISPIPPVRRVLFAVAVPLAAILPPAAGEGQTTRDIPGPGDAVYEIQLADGSQVFARIAELDEDGELVVLVTVGGGRLEIDRSQIQQLRPARGRVRDGEFWSEDPGSTRLLFTSTGRSLARSESYIGTYLVILPFAAVGLTDRVTIAAGAPVLFGEFEPVYIAPKVQVVRSPTVQASLGTLAFFFDDEVVGIAYGVGTFGDDERALSAGLGYFYSGDDFVNEPAFMVGGETRVSRRVKLITENYVLPDALGVVLSGGIRVIGDRFNTEVAVFGAQGDDEGGCCLPAVNFSYSFGR
ncbi:MAG: hypothetical protein OXT72_03255 [Gammaproteobacteria bacterium]|nr:hypothetical protein [Gammaproteobacteria bacterium]MDE0249276.1 hypothetical protein [Gammaproteobacteria bacterium]